MVLFRMIADPVHACRGYQGVRQKVVTPQSVRDSALDARNLLGSTLGAPHGRGGKLFRALVVLGVSWRAA